MGTSFDVDDQVELPGWLKFLFKAIGVIALIAFAIWLGAMLFVIGAFIGMLLGVFRLKK